MNRNPNQTVLVFSGVRGDTRRYRTLHVYEQLRLAGVDCVLSHLTDPRLPEQVKGARVAIVHRVAYDDYAARLLDQLHQNGALVILDADDFLYDPAIMRFIDSPDFQDPVRAGLYRQEILRHRATLERCDAVTVSTNSLAGMMEPFGLPARIHRNAYSLEMLALSNAAVQNRTRPDGRVVIGYASGTRTHDRDFQMILPALRAVMECHSQVELWLMGDVDPGAAGDCDSLRGRVKSFPRVPWRELPARLALFDINLAPLILDSPFNQAKSEIKFMEAALVGVPTIASQTDAFSFAIRHGLNGLLANSVEEWQTALEHLIGDATAREALGAAAYQDVLSDYSPEARGAELLQTLSYFSAQSGTPGLEFHAEFAAHNSQGEEPPKKQLASKRFYFSAADEDHPNMVEMARYSIRHRGTLTLLKQGWVYFRRKLAPIFPFQGSKNE